MRISKSLASEHAVDELVDLLFAVAPGTTLHEGLSLSLPSLSGVGKLEGPQEVVGLSEVSTNGPELVDQVLNAGDTVLSEDGVNNRVVLEGFSAAVDLTEATAVDELGDGGTAGETVGDQGLDLLDHVPGGLVQFDEGTVVDLSETEELHDLSLLGGELVDTAGTDNECELSLTFNEERAGLLGVTLALDESGISGGVLLGVLLGVGESLLSLGSGVGLLGLTVSNDSGENLGVTRGLLGEVLGNDSGLLGGFLGGSGSKHIKGVSQLLFALVLFRQLSRKSVFNAAERAF